MKNVTLAIEEDVLNAARKYAVKHNTTVNGMVREYLTRLVKFEDRAAEARKRLKELSEELTLELGSWKWNREELYDRKVLSRHEHSPLRGFEEPGESDKKTESD